jgi:cell division protein FtsB
VRSVSIAPAVVAVGLAAALGLAVLDRESGLLTWLELSKERSEARAQIEDQRLANAILAQRIEAIQSDPHQADRAIREALDLAKPGETIVRFRRGNAPRKATPRGTTSRFERGDAPRQLYPAEQPPD